MRDAEACRRKRTWAPAEVSRWLCVCTFGIERYRWPAEEGTVRIARVVVPYRSSVENFWAVPSDQYRLFYLILRRQIVTARWHSDLAAGVDVDNVVADTRGFSFAEIEEALKLLVMRYVESRRWDCPWVRQAMSDRYQAQQPARPICFSFGTNGERRMQKAVSL